jgi:hypothetical protein
MLALTVLAGRRRSGERRMRRRTEGGALIGPTVRPTPARAVSGPHTVTLPDLGLRASNMEPSYGRTKRPIPALSGGTHVRLGAESERCASGERQRTPQGGPAQRRCLSGADPGRLCVLAGPEHRHHDLGAAPSERHCVARRQTFLFAPILHRHAPPAIRFYSLARAAQPSDMFSTRSRRHASA